MIDYRESGYASEAQRASVLPADAVAGLFPTAYGWRPADAEIHDPVVVLRPENVMFGSGCRVDSFVKIEGGQGVVFGRYVHVSSFAHVNIGGGRLTVGEGSALASGCRVFGGSNTGAAPYPSSAAPADLQHVERAASRIGRGVFVCAGATVLPGLTIGDYAVIGAGAVLTRDVKPYEVWAGVPAVRIGDRRTRAGDYFDGGEPGRLVMD